MIRRREALMGTILATGGALALLRRPPVMSVDASSGELDAILDCPMKGWRAMDPGEVITGTTDELGAASYSELGVRLFKPERGGGITVLLARGSAQTYATQLHRPELCYPASGFKILDYRIASLALDKVGGTIPTSIMIAQRGDRVDTVLYWTRVGNSFPTGLWEQRLQIAKGALAGNRQEEVLARFSITSSLTAAGEQALKAFLPRFLSAQNADGKRILLGQG